MRWRGRLSPSLLRATGTIQECEVCLPPHEGAGVDACRECRVSLDSGRLPKACSVNNMAIGCEHRYPEELDSLSPVEERLIALHTPFGFITKFTVDSKTPSGINYRKHMKAMPISVAWEDDSTPAAFRSTDGRRWARNDPLSSVQWAVGYFQVNNRGRCRDCLGDATDLMLRDTTLRVNVAQ
ncbi:hypothetical protein HIM_09326 [Hirsutella minnesotensis 3608]|uniref:DUF6570 domain-containing protein n=1 Tax=Hirsutella minnesotensis 3608 TaxID=1043627 RepID=A0A0F7ZSF1_9HYPO|nr:hypothetical protein HIM_09326 [Hirsutella minnesotensis 3608]